MVVMRGAALVLALAFQPANCWLHAFATAPDEAAPAPPAIERDGPFRNFSVVLRGPEVLRARVVDSLTGVYVASFTPRRAGSYAVSVDYDGLPIFGSPYTAVVVPGKAHAPASVVKCVDAGAPAKECAALVGVAGEVNALTIVARDTAGNDCDAGGEKRARDLARLPRIADNLGGSIRRASQWVER